MSDFASALSFVLAREGGLSEDVADPGGRTNLGITQKAWDAWRVNQAPDAPADVAELTPGLPVISYFYRDNYWTPCGCDGLDQGPALALFDAAVNLGVSHAINLWQQAGQAVAPMLWLRLKYYDDLARIRPEMAKFLSGWVRRVILLREAVG